MLVERISGNGASSGTPFACKARAGRGVFNEARLSAGSRNSSKIEEAEESRQTCLLGQYRPALSGSSTIAGAGFPGGILAGWPVNSLLAKLVQPAYLIGLAASMAGWAWIIFVGLGWVFGA